MSNNCMHPRPIIIKLPSKRFCLEYEPNNKEIDSGLCSLNEDLDTTATPEYGQFENSSDTDDSEATDASRGRKFMEYWKDIFPFLAYDKKKNVMYCKTCRQHSGPTQRNMHFVAGTNNFRFTTVVYHKKSALHFNCRKLAAAHETGDPMALLDNDEKKLVQVLKLVYFMIKTRIPFSDFPKLCKSRKEFGLDIGSAYTSHQTVVPFFAKYIAQNIENELSKKLEGCGMFSLIIDSTLTRVSENQQLVYVKYFKDELRTEFLGVIDTSGNSSSIFENLNKLFRKFNFSSWMNNVVHVFVDTWTNYPTWYCDFVATLNAASPSSFITNINIFPHKIRRCSRFFSGNFWTQHFKWLIYDIFWFYNNLPEERKNLLHINKELDAIVVKHGSLHKKISSCFSFDAFGAVNKDWVSLVRLLKNPNTSKLDARTQNLRVKILQSVTKSKFLWKLALVLDIFKCLTDISSKVDDPNFTLSSLPSELKQASHALRDSVRGRGEHVQQFQRDMHMEDSGAHFRNVKVDLNFSPEEVITQMPDAATAIVDHMNRAAKDLSWLEDTRILDTRKWTKDGDLDLFGNSEFCNLYLRLLGSEGDLHAALREWCTLKTNVTLCFPPDVLGKPQVAIPDIVNVFRSELPVVTTVLEKILLIDLSSEELEKGYTETNLLKSSDRSRLSVSALHNSMVIALHGPPISRFNPLPVMETFMDGCVRRYHKRKGTANYSCDAFLDAITITPFEVE